MEKEKLSQLENTQKKLNRLQGEQVFRIVKTMPKWFWVMFLVITVTMLNTLRLHYVMKDMVKAEFQKTEINRSLALKYHKNRSEREAGLRDQIEHLQKQIQLKQIGKQFYHAVANELGGSPKDQVNYHLNKMFSNDHAKASLVKDNWIIDALELGAIHSAEGIGKRIELVKNKEKFESIARMAEIIKENPKAWEDFINKNNNLPQHELDQ